HTRSKRDWSSDVCSSDLNSVSRGIPADFEAAFFFYTGPGGADRQVQHSGFTGGGFADDVDEKGLRADSPGQVTDQAVRRPQSYEIGRARCREVVEGRDGS